MSLSLKIKTTDGRTIETSADPDLTIFDLKAICCEELQTSPEQQTLLFKGNVCNDDDTLESIQISNNCTLIVLLKKQIVKKKSETKTEEPEEKKVNNHNLNNGNNNMLSMQQSLMQNPDILKEMMNNPMIQQMFNNPETLQSIFKSSPAMQKLLEKNPELRHAMKDPEVMKQMMRAATDPNYRKELMQNQDRMLRNIESMPGGFNALSRMYNQVQNPMESAMDDMYQKHFGKSKTKITEVDKANGPTTQPIENPWSPNSNQSMFPQMGNGANGANGNGNNMLNMMNMMKMMNGMNFNNPQSNPMGMDQSANARRAYVVQLRELRNMGFHDEQKNIEALIATGGDIGGAIEYLSGNKNRKNDGDKKQ